MQEKSMPRRVPGASTAAAVAIFLMLSATLYAQVSTASINGTVTDPQGAVITGAQLTLTNVETNVELRTVTNEAGLYRFLNLTVGRYTLSASSQGFSPKKVEPFTLRVGQEATLDFALSVGALADAVTVQATGVEVQSSSAELGSAIEHKQVVDLPLSGRNFTALLLLQPGVNAVQVSGTQSLSYTRPIGTVYNPSVNGQNNRANMYLLDGIVNIETFGNAYAIPPIVDAIQEFKVQSHNDSSDIGMAAGGTVNVATKSGTNELHGTAWEFIQNDAFNARNAFQPSVTPFKQNQYGVTAGGPAIIPKIYNGKNRSFFFVAWEGYRYRSPAFNYFNVPTAAMVGGDFSAPWNGVVRPIYDPLTTKALPDGSFSREPFIGNIIPKSRIDTGMAAYFAALVPQPMVTNRAGYNAVNTAGRTKQQDSWSVRGDHMLSQKDMLWFRYSALQQYALNPGRTFMVAENDMLAHNLGTSWNHTFGPTSTLQLQFGMSFVKLPDVTSYVGAPSDLASKMGLGAGLTQYRTGGVTLLPGVAVNNWFSGGENYTVNRPGDNWQVKGNYSKILGNHTFKFGAEFIRADMGMVIDYHSVNFQEFDTSDLVHSATTGNSVASALLNVPYQSTRRDLLESLRFGGAFGAYFSDSWKFSPKLTINLGIRYDYVWIPGFGTVADKNIYTGNMDTDTGQYWVLKVPESCAKLGAAPCIPTADGSLPANVIHAPGDTIMHGSSNMWGPRIGAAYRLFPNTAIRASAGVFFDSWAGVYQSARGIGGNWPMVATTMYGNLNNPTPTTPFPNVKMNADWLGATNLPPALPWQMNWWYMDPAWNNGYSMQYNFGVQHQLSNSTVVEVDYVGSGGRRLDLGAARNTAVTPGPGDPTARMRFPYMKPTYFAKSIGRSNYNALQMSYRRSFSGGLSAIVNYTWSKAIDIACSGFFGTEGCQVQNEYDLNSSRSISAFNVPHNFVTSVTYELPIGKGKLLSSKNGVLDYIIGGWQVNALVQLRNNMPFTITVPGDVANVGNPNTYERANVVGDWHISNPSIAGWFNTKAFAQPAQFTYGNSGRNILYPDWQRRLDASMFRQFPIKERLRFELRAEAYGLTNTTIFNTPVSSLAAFNFGQVTGSSGERSMQLGAKVIW
jgi:hypothetical protein